MDDVILLENPRKRRTPPRLASGRFRKTKSRRKTTRRRPRNPAAVVAAPRRRKSPVRRRRTATAKRRSPVSRRRRSNPSRGGRMLSMRRITGLLGDGASLALGEFVGDIAARALDQKTPVGGMIANMGGNFLPAGGQRAVLQILVGITGDQLLKTFRAPRILRKYFAVSNIASGLIALTGGWRAQAQGAMGLADWVEVGRPALEAPSGGAEIAGMLSDWETVGSVPGLDATGDPFSM